MASLSKPREGELYKRITAYGKEFVIRYGYYEDADRQNPATAPIEMYPDFVKAPVYTTEGLPFITAMQPPCPHFRGAPDEDNTCYQCTYYEGCEELLGVCRSPARKNG